MVHGSGEQPGGASLAERVRRTADFVLERGVEPPQIALILGTGLGDLADRIESPIVISYSEIPNFPVSTVVGHAGRLVLGRLEGLPVVAMQGRVHLYEGYSTAEIAFPTRVMRRMGATTLVVTNAAGGLNEHYRSGDMMLIADHLNMPGMAGANPLLGLNAPELGARFLDMLGAYDAELRGLARQVAERNGFAVQEGVYAMVAGPSFETMAEIRFLQRAGADAVGMSTVPEVIVARQEQMRVLGISAITNSTVGQDADAQISHADVLATAGAMKPRLEALVRGVLKRLAREHGRTE